MIEHVNYNKQATPVQVVVGEFSELHPPELQIRPDEGVGKLLILSR